LERLVGSERWKEKGRAETGTAKKGRDCSTSYGGVTRVRFGGSIPRAGKSRLRERGAPLSYVAERLEAARADVKKAAKRAENAF